MDRTRMEIEDNNYFIESITATKYKEKGRKERKRIVMIGQGAKGNRIFIRVGRETLFGENEQEEDHGEEEEG